MCVLAEIVMVAIMDVLIVAALANTTLSNTDVWIAGTMTAVFSFGIVIDTATRAWRKSRQPPSTTIP